VIEEQIKEKQDEKLSNKTSETESFYRSSINIHPQKYFSRLGISQRPGFEPASLKRMVQAALEKEKAFTAPKFDSKQHKDKTRSKIALIFTWGYFAIITLGLVGVPTFNFLISYFLPQTSLQPLDLKDAILTIGSILGSTFGFVLGYYFKGSEEN